MGWLCLKAPSVILCLTASPTTPVTGLLVSAAPADRTGQPWSLEQLLGDSGDSGDSVSP